MELNHCRNVLSRVELRPVQVQEVETFLNKSIINYSSRYSLLHNIVVRSSHRNIHVHLKWTGGYCIVGAEVGVFIVF